MKWTTAFALAACLLAVASAVKIGVGSNASSNTIDSLTTASSPCRYVIDWEAAYPNGTYGPHTGQIEYHGARDLQFTFGTYPDACVGQAQAQGTPAAQKVAFCWGHYRVTSVVALRIQGTDVIAGAANCCNSAASVKSTLPFCSPTATSTFGKQAIASCSASSTFEANTCEKAYDGDTSSSWASLGEGVSSWISFTFAGSKTINRMKYANRQASNERNKDVTLQFSDGSTQSVELSDDANLNSFTLQEKTTDSVNITVVSVYSQSYNGAREVEFWHEDTSASTAASSSASTAASSSASTV